MFSYGSVVAKLDYLMITRSPVLLVDGKGTKWDGILLPIPFGWALITEYKNIYFSTWQVKHVSLEPGEIELKSIYQF